MTGIARPRNVSTSVPISPITLGHDPGFEARTVIEAAHFAAISRRGEEISVA
jgi:hypothetical protein